MQVIDHTKLYEAGLSRQIALDSTGAYVVYIDELPQVLTYNGPGGGLDTITVGPDPLGFSFRQTMTYTGSRITGVSAWVKQ